MHWWSWLRRHHPNGTAARDAQQQADRQLEQAQAQRPTVDAIERASLAALRRKDDFTAAVERAMRRPA
jgi:hypothetical protein